MASVAPWMDHKQAWDLPICGASIIRTWWFAPVVVSLLLNCLLLGTRGSLDGHEVLVAQTAREMVRSGDWIHPTLAGSPRYQKPPLGYWYLGVVYTGTGHVSEVTARLPSLISGVLLTLLVAYVARCWFGRAAAIVAGVMQSTMVWSLVYSSSAITDMTLSLIVAVGVLCVAADRLFPQVKSTSVILSFWILGGFAVLTKGPVGWLVMLLTAIVFGIRKSGRVDESVGRLFFSFSAIFGMLLFVVLAGGWPLAVAWTQPDVLALWNEQSLGRFVAHWGPQTRPWYYYLYQVPLLTLPWISPSG